MRSLKTYDALMFAGQPDLRTYGMEPAYFACDQDFNYATAEMADSRGEPRHDNTNFTFTRPSQTERTMFAWRRIARVAAGIERDIADHARFRPSAYSGAPHQLVLDIEGPQFMQTIDMEQDSRVRAKAIDELVRRVTAMRDEAMWYGRKLPIGSYLPITPIGQKIHPKDARFPGLMEQAERDYRPLMDVIDVSFPDCYIHSDDLETQWFPTTRATIDGIKRLLPDKPIIASVTLGYGHYATPDKMGWLLPIKTWSNALRWLREQPDIDGVCFWGGVAYRNEKHRDEHRADMESQRGVWRQEWDATMKLRVMMAIKLLSPETKLSGIESTMGAAAMSVGGFEELEQLAMDHEAGKVTVA